MQSLTPDQRKSFEEYLLADGDPIKSKKAIDLLVKGSIHHDYLFLLDEIKRNEHKAMSPEAEAVFAKLAEQFEKNKMPHQDRQIFESLLIRSYFNKYDAAEINKDENQRKLALDKIKSNFISTWFEHRKPVKEGINDIQDGGQDTLDVDEVLNLAGAQRIFEAQLADYVQYLEASKKKLNDEIATKIEHNIQRAKSDCQSNMSFLFQQFQANINLFLTSQTYAQSFNFTKYEPEVVFMFAMYLSQTQKNFFTQFQSESLFQSIADYSKEFDAERQKTNEKVSKGERNNEEQDFWKNGAMNLNAMTLVQMDKLKALNPDFFSSDEQFCAAYFKKQFSEELSPETQSLQTVEERLENLKRLEEHARSHNLPKMLRKEFRNEILSLGPEIGQYDEKLFLDYLEDNEKTSHIFKNYTSNLKDFAKKPVQINRNKVQQYFNSYKPLLETQTPLVMKYLRHFCIASKGILKKFEKYFEAHILLPIVTEVRILQATDGLASLKDTSITLEEFRAVSERVILEFTEINKKIFQVDEEVSVEVNLKNIQKLYVRVFEFNTETYYKKNLANFDTNVNLDGLEARIKDVREYAQPSNILHSEKFVFEHLKGKVGIFIIEMMGNGMSSRAVIKKGSLSLVHRSTIAGQQIFILDEKKRILKGGDCRTGVIIEEKFYPASKEKGRIDIPFAKTEHTTPIILIRDEFAELQQFVRKTEKFQFAAKFYLNQESMLVGSSTSIVIRPKLLINGRQANLKMLKNSKAELRITNYVDDIPVTKNFDQLNFTNEKEVTVQFQVPPNLGSVQIKLSTQVQNSTTRKMENFTAERSFGIVAMSKNQNVADAYLKRENGNYNVLFLGRNGEPFESQKVDIVMTHLQSTKQLNKELVTDKNGAIHLGKLIGVPSLSVAMRSQRIASRWNLTAQESKYNAQYVHPSQITLLEGESLVLPVSLPSGLQKLTREQVTLIRSLNNSVIEDCFENIKVELIGDQQSGYHQMKVDGMQQGSYYLSLLTGYEKKEINIVVSKGEYWEESEGFILMKDRLQTTQDAANILQIAGVQIEEAKNGQHNVSVTVDNATKQVRLHAIATTFVQNEGNELARNLHEMLEWSSFTSSFMFKNQPSIYMSNKKVSDEIRYVFERKQLEAKLGNTLERPSLLIKKNFIRDTNEDTETLAQGDHFAGHQLEFADYDVIGDRAGAKAFGSLSNTVGSGRFNESSELINFLKNPPVQMFNLTSVGGDDDESSRRTITFDLKLAHYSQLYLVVVDKESLVQRNVDVDLAPSIVKRDLRLNKVLDSQKGITETRQTIKLASSPDQFEKQGKPSQFKNSDFIEDITSSEVQLVDSISKVVEILEEIQKMSGNNSSAQDWEKFKFIKEWSTLSANEKDRYYSEFMCHEFNLYLRKHDTEYFDAVVKPFLQYKMEKKFIDHYLLQNFKECNKHAEFALFNKLNALEVCLLVDSLVQSNQVPRAVSIVTQLNLQMESTNASSADKVTLRNKIFDLVLNLNTLNDVKGDLAKLHDNIKQKEERENQRNRMCSESSEEEDDDHDQNSCCARGMDSEYDDEFCSSASINQNRGEPTQLLSAMPQRGRGGRLIGRAAPQQERFRALTSSKAAIFGDDYAELSSLRGAAIKKQEFEEVEQTSEYMETHYYQQTELQSFQNLIPVNQFWVDYANFLLKPLHERGAFISDNFVDCSSSKMQIFLIQCILDLPQQSSSSHSFTPDEQRGVTIKAGCNMILYKKFIAEANLDLKRDIKVIHRYQQLSGANESEQQSGKPNPFLCSTPYKCEVVLTNVSPKTKSFSLLYQIPFGAMPMLQSKNMKSHFMQLHPYTTQKVTFEFYFPIAGQYTHFPSNISVDQIVQARGEPNILLVEKSRRITQIESFVDLLLTGTKEDVLKFLETEVLVGSEKKFDSADMLYLLKDKEFFHQAIAILTKRKHFDMQVWSYAFFHSDSTEIMRQYLHFREQDLHQLCTFFTSSLISFDQSNAVSGFTKHLEYHPMVNRRAHKVGTEGSNRILNQQFRSTYDNFLTTMAQKKAYSDADKLCFAYYLQLQDREQEAINLFSQIKQPHQGELRIQYDYLQAYLEFFKNDEKDFLKAREIVRKYDNFPVTGWRMMFLAIQDQLNEIDGEFDDEDLEPLDEESKDFDVKIAEKRKENKKKSFKREPNLNSVELDANGTIKLETVNVREVLVKYYNINAELMFTRAPFIKDNTEAFTYVMPFHTEKKQMVPEEADEAQLNAVVTGEIQMPAKLKNLNLVIEINGAEKQQFKTFYSNQLKITTLESYGELKVAHAVTGKALPRVYVKVFGLHKTTNKEFFFRDGYTDIRGKIEYSQTSGDKLKNVKRFAILVVSDQYGSKILECDPPKGEFGAAEDQPVQVLGASKPVQSQAQSKMLRLENRQMYVKSKKSSK